MSNTPTLNDGLRELDALEDPRVREVNERRGDDHGVNLTRVRELVHRSRDASNSRKREFVRSADGCPPFSGGGGAPHPPPPPRTPPRWFVEKH